jgi:hypothetical protein
MVEQIVVRRNYPFGRQKGSLILFSLRLDVNDQKMVGLVARWPDKKGRDGRELPTAPAQGEAFSLDIFLYRSRRRCRSWPAL